MNCLRCEIQRVFFTKPKKKYSIKRNTNRILNFEWTQSENKQKCQFNMMMFLFMKSRIKTKYQHKVLNNWKLRILHYELRVIQLWPCISMFLYWKINAQVLFTDNQTFVHFNSQLWKNPALFFTLYCDIFGFNIVIAFHCTLLLRELLMEQIFMLVLSRIVCGVRGNRVTILHFLKKRRTILFDSPSHLQGVPWEYSC
jgi:hypothetical protein